MSDASAVRAEKARLRDEIRARRGARSAEDRQAAGEALTRHAVHLTQQHGATTVATYLSTPEEPSTRGFLAWARANGIRVLLPISRQDGLMDWAEFDETETEGPYGVPEPAGEVLPPTAIEEAGLILLPASAADRHGMRMGWGRGFFDKLLNSFASLPPTYAMVYDDEWRDEVPAEPHDRAVHGVVTPSGVFRIAEE